jgi:dTDP-4-dehydrorhamnose reductase
MERGAGLVHFMSAPLLITGGSGQLALALEAAAKRPVRRVGRPDFDFGKTETLVRTVQEIAPSAILNAAAWTAVDLAESEPDAAARANRNGPAVLAALCAEGGIPLLHVSTDYVFDGLKGAPYVETDQTRPTGIYGLTKLEGEKAVLSLCPQAIVLRTSWVYSPTGKNFVRTMLNAARKAPTLRVVGDQIGCPTAAADLAEAMLAITDMALAGWRDEYAGVFHAAGTGATSWHGFASAVFDEAAPFGHPVPQVDAITTADWPTPVRRPPDSRLCCDKLEAVFGLRLPDWRTSLARTVEEIKSTEAEAALSPQRV